jgi:release factor glutamine methyltransferase
LVSNLAHQQDLTAQRTVESLVDTLSSALRLGGIDNPRRVAIDIVAALLDVPRSWPVMNREATIDESIVAVALNAARKIAQGAPFAYSVGRAEFRHLSLAIDQRVLIPRPETEVLVGEILNRMKASFGEASWGTAVDVGTGSGAIALSLAAEGCFDHVIGTDASHDALDVARSNANTTSIALRHSIEFRHGSLLSPVRDVKASVIVSNPPYIAYSEAEALPSTVRDWEPPIALFSGHDGMAATAGIVRDAAECLVPGGLLALEVDERRASIAADMIMRNGAYRDVAVGLDLTGRERFVFAWRI